jgi:hypothetical protein
MKIATAFVLFVVCLANVSGRVLEKSIARDSDVCAFYIDTPVSLSDPTAKDLVASALNGIIGNEELVTRFNNGTNDVAVFTNSISCDSLTTALVPKLLESALFDNDVRILHAMTGEATQARKCTYGGTCKWWKPSCTLYRTCGKGWVSGGMAGAGDLYGNPCTSSCRTKCYSYCQCLYDTSCYGKK